MNYYTEFISKNELKGLEYGELINDNGKYKVSILGGSDINSGEQNCFNLYQEVEVENNRGIHNDIVYINKINMQVVSIKHRNIKPIVGLLHLDSNQKFGFNKKGIPFYKFTPLSSNYPQFIVPSKIKTKKLVYCIISFNKWERNNKNPVGQIEEIIGDVGDINNEIKAALYFSDVMPVKNNILYVSESANDKMKLDLMERGNIYHTFSIDPEGCLDIDDAFHFKKLGHSNGYNQYEIGIHIANVGRYLEDFNINMYSTIYLDGKQINMLNEHYTYNVCSLGSGKEKLALSLIMKYTDNMLVDYYFQESIVINHPYSYDEAGHILNHHNFSLKSYSKIDHQLINFNTFHTLLTGEKHTPTTKLVEYYMLTYNRIVAKTLYQYDPKTILRTHQMRGNDIEKFGDDPVLSGYLHKVNQNAAKYISNPIDTRHQIMGVDFYTHATSPIRRYVDIVNQMNIIRYLYDEELKIDIDTKIDDINLFQKKLRKFYNYHKKIKIIFNNVFIENTDAYIIDIKFNKIKIYIPELDIEHSFNPVSYKFIETNNVYLGENHLDINGTMLFMYQNIKICVSMLRQEKHFNKKIRIKMIEPFIETY
jgi:exoribonuclease R